MKKLNCSETVVAYLYPNVNWVDEVLKKNTTQSITNLNITGGTEVVRYFVNVGYTTQSGLYRDNGDNAYSTNSRVNRYNYRSRVDVNLTKDLSVELGVGGIIQNRNFPGKSQYDIFYAIRNTSPLAFPVKNPDGTPGASPTYLGNNPWGMTTQSGYETQNWNTLQGTFSARWDLSSLVTEGLSVSGRFAYDHYYSNNKQYYKDFEVKQYMGEDAEGNAIYNILRNENIKNVTLAESANRAIYYEVAANYDRTFGMHNITGMFLFNRRDYVTCVIRTVRDPFLIVVRVLRDVPAITTCNVILQSSISDITVRNSSRKVSVMAFSRPYHWDTF